MATQQILVVEDETIIAMDLQNRLRNLGFDAPIAASGEEAISKAGLTHPDLVLMDIVLPGSTDGIEAARQIRSRFDIPIVYLTAYSDANTLQRARQTEPYGYLLKPLKDRELYATVDMALHKHKIEKRLKESEERYRDLVENSHDLICTHDLTGLILSANRATVELLGYYPDDLINKINIRDILPPANRDLFGDYLRTIQVEGTARGTMLVRTSANETRVLEYHNTLRREGVPTPIVRGLAHDVTERSLSEKLRARRVRRAALRADVSLALAEPNAPLGKILQSCVESIVEQLDAAFARIWTVDEKESMLELQASAGIYRHLNGRHSRISVGQLKVGRIAQEHQPKLSNDLANDPDIDDKVWAAQTGLVGFAGYPLRVEDRLVGVMAMFARHKLGEDTLEALAQISDIISQGIERKRAESALRKSEDQLRQAQRLEAVGKLAGGVAHDFNNLLTAIIGYSDLSLNRLSQADPLWNSISEIKKAGERAAGLTRQLLAFSRKQVLQPRILDLNRIVSDMGNMLQRLIGEDIELKTILAPALPSVKADIGQIEQVILNIAVNARDAMPQGGRLTLETGSVVLDPEYASRHIAVAAGDYVLLAISDTGCGMDEQTQAHIFEPFYTTKDIGKGTGLGLSTVYGIIKQSGGAIWVYSELGQGSTFKIYLPVANQPPDEIKRASYPAVLPQGTETILLAEDEATVRKLAREVLEKQGYKVLEASNGGVALLLCERHEGAIDLLLTDVIMPEMSGRELADRLKQLRPAMRVLYMSGYTENAAMRLGAMDQQKGFIEKPFSPASLALKVREMLDGIS